MKDRTYYLVNVAYKASNPVHRAIAYHSYKGYVQLFNGSYENVIEKHVEHLTTFEVVEEIKGMKG